MQPGAEFGGRGDAGAADLAEQLHLAQRQPVVWAVPAHLPGHRHHRFPQLGGGDRQRRVITKLYLGNFFDVILISRMLQRIISKGILVIGDVDATDTRWALLTPVTVAVTIPLTMARCSVRRAVRRAGRRHRAGADIAGAQAGAPPDRHRRPGCARRLHRHHGSPRRGQRSRPDWPIVVAVAVATLLLSIVAGALLGLHRDVSPLTGSLALVAGGASGLVAIARELGGDDRVVAVVQYLRVALVTASMPVVVTLIYHADRSHHAATSSEPVRRLGISASP